jgi:outer membrane cobalamin receptor
MWVQMAFGQDAGVPTAIPTTVVTANSNEEFGAASTVRRSSIDAQLARSAPDALKFEPGVSVQQTSHGQASVFLRGLTGQQTVLMFDSIRLNTSTWRQGPNQYFFTVDNNSIESFDIYRGGASTRFGSDALGGVIVGNPVEQMTTPLPQWKGQLALKGTTADKELGAKGRISFSNSSLGFTGGMSGRVVSLLESSGPLPNVSVPRFLNDNRTQRGTGFKELTGDARLVIPLNAHLQALAAVYAYRQFDAPRTDRCPAPQAADDECLTIEEQFRTLSYVGLDGAFETVKFKTRISWQRQHEARKNVRPQSFVENFERDTVDTVGFHFSSQVQRNEFFKISIGTDAYVDSIDSAAFVSLADLNVVRKKSRGQYVAHSSAFTGGVFSDIGFNLNKKWSLATGARVGWAAAYSPGDSASDSLPLNASWPTWAAHALVAFAPISEIKMYVSADRSFRAPNLDDLTSRQQTGPGFQFENAMLIPETSTAFEIGFKFVSPRVQLNISGFQMILENTVSKSYREVSQCPPSDVSCLSSRFRLSLVNSPGLSSIRGVEFMAKLQIIEGLSARITGAYTFGNDAQQLPLSRIPPGNVTAELKWMPWKILSTSLIARGALEQNRLALTDTSDARIPLGGTAGYLVLDARASLKLFSKTQVYVVFENIFDSPYRIHGSSINGAGRGLLISVNQEI